MKITRRQLRQIIKEEILSEQEGVSLSDEEITTLAGAGFSVAGLDRSTLTPDMKNALAHAASGGDMTDWLPPAEGTSDGLDNDGDGYVDEEGEDVFFQGNTVGSFIKYLQRLDESLEVKCYLGEGAYLTQETSATFSVLQPGDGTEEVEITTPTLAIVVEAQKSGRLSQKPS